MVQADFIQNMYFREQQNIKKTNKTKNKINGRKAH